MPAEKALHVEGLRELQRAFFRIDRSLGRDLQGVLRDAAEPVRSDAEQLALSRIRRMTLPWSRMKVGVTRSLVYVAPVERGKRSRVNRNIRRPNLADLLMGRAMTPALDANQEKVVQSVESLLDHVGREWEQ